MNIKRICPISFRVNGYLIQVSGSNQGFIRVISARKFVSYHKLIAKENSGGLAPRMFYNAAIGEYRRREQERNEGPLKMSNELFDAHCEAARRYFWKFGIFMRRGMFEFAKENWIPDEIIRGSERDIIVLKYGENVAFYQEMRRPEKIKKYGLTKHVSWTLNEESSGKVPELKLTDEIEKKMKFFADLIVSHTRLP